MTSRRSNFAMIDLGGWASGGRLHQFPSGTLPTLSLVKLGCDRQRDHRPPHGRHSVSHHAKGYGRS